MDEALNKIAKLENELKEMEENLLLSANFGKDLLENNELLNSKLIDSLSQNQANCEKLEQENYALNMKCQNKESNVISLSSELDHIEAANKDNVDQLKQTHLEEISKLNNKLSSQFKLVAHLEDEKCIQASLINEIQLELKCLKEREHETILSELSISMADDTFQSKIQIVSLTNEKTELEQQLKEAQRDLKQFPKKISFFEESMRQIGQQLEHSECEVSTLHNIIERKKTEIVELQVEIENMNIDHIDPKKRGNSLFAELEDNRQLVERKYLELKENFKLLQCQYEYKHDQNNRLKTHVASLLLNSGNRGSLEYQEELQSNVVSLKLQLLKMVSDCKALQQENDKQCPCLCSKKDTNPESILDGHREMYKQAQDEIRKKSDEVRKLLFEKVYLTDKILELQRKNNMTNNSKASLSAEVIRLRVKLDECGVDLDKEADNPVISRHTEKLPFFEEIQRKKAENLAKQQSVEKTKDDISQKNGTTIQQETNEEKSSEMEANEEVPIQLPREPDIKTEAKENQQNRTKCKSVKFNESAITKDELQVDRLPLKEKNTRGSKRKLKKMDAPRLMVTDQNSGECKQQ